MSTLQDHYDAVKVPLARGILASRVYDTVRVNGSTPVRDNYVVLIDDSPVLDENRYTALDLPGSRSRHRFDVRSVATSANGRRMYQQAVRDNLIGVVPVVAGRVCSAVQLVGAVEEGQPEFDSTAQLHHVLESYEYWSWRA